jgi:hypothetical protein
LEPDLSERFNDGVVPAPELEVVEPARLQPPDWQPTASQLETARKQYSRNILLLIVLVGVVLLLIALAFGWRP